MLDGGDSLVPGFWEDIHNFLKTMEKGLKMMSTLTLSGGYCQGPLICAGDQAPVKVYIPSLPSLTLGLCYHTWIVAPRTWGQTALVNTEVKEA